MAHALLTRLLTTLVVVALVLATGATALAQDASPVASPTAGGAGPSVGDAVVLFDDRGDALAQVAVLDVVDPFEETTSGAQRGYHYVAVEIAVQNLGDDVYPVDIFSLRVVDGEGTFYTNRYLTRTDDSRTATADLQATELEAGAATSGYLVYELVDGAAPAAIVAINGRETLTVLADLTGLSPVADQATTLYDERGDEIGSVGLGETLPALEESSDSVDVARGQTVLGAVVTIENTSDDPITPDPYAMYVVDELGYLYGATTFSRDETERAELPDLPVGEIAAGDRASGLVAFILPTEAQVSYLVYLPGGSQLFVVAQPGGDPVVSGDVLTPVPPVVEDDGSVDGTDDTGTDDAGESTPVAAVGCDDLSEWVELIRFSFAALGEIEVIQFSAGDEQLVAGDLREGADEVRAIAEAQSKVDVPAVAGPYNDAFVTLLETLADTLDEGADDLDDGASSRDVSVELTTGDSDLIEADAAFGIARSELVSSCPDFDF